MGKFIEKLSMENLHSFFKLFNGDKCENCQCTFYFCANDIDNWCKMSIEEAKELRKNITSKCCDGYIYYIDNKPVAWCQCASPKDVHYLKNLLQINSNENTRIISCFFIKKEYRGIGIQKELLEKVIGECKREEVKSIYSIPVFDDFLNIVNEELKLEKLHTGYKKLFDEFDFDCIGNNGRYYFMNKILG